MNQVKKYTKNQNKKQEQQLLILQSSKSYNYNVRIDHLFSTKNGALTLYSPTVDLYKHYMHNILYYS